MISETTYQLAQALMKVLGLTFDEAVAKAPRIEAAMKAEGILLLEKSS